MKNKSVIVDHARSNHQREVLEQISQDGVCPFCLENLARYHMNPITIIGQYWVVTQNQWPYEHAWIQLLIIPKRHVETLSELTAEELVEWSQMILQTLERYGIDSGAVCTRFGDPTQTGASVRHLHTQIIVHSPADDEPVRYKIGTSKK